MFSSLIQRGQNLVRLLVPQTFDHVSVANIYGKNRKPFWHDNSMWWKYTQKSKKKQPANHKNQIPIEKNLEKPMQMDWWSYDGIGRYRTRHHDYPVNMMLRDVQKRRTFAKFHEERIKINAVWKNNILPEELRDLAYRKVQEVPRDSTVQRINRRCAVTGRPRGIFHQFRVSRFIFRNEADYNRISGARRADWLKGIDIKP